MANEKASHRRQFRFYNEDIELIKALRKGNESDTSVVRRCLKQMELLNRREDFRDLPLYRQTLCSYDPTGQELLFQGSFDEFYSREHMSVQVQVQAAQEAAEENKARLETIEQLLSELLDH